MWLVLRLLAPNTLSEGKAAALSPEISVPPAPSPSPTPSLNPDSDVDEDAPADIADFAVEGGISSASEVAVALRTIEGGESGSARMAAPTPDIRPSSVTAVRGRSLAELGFLLFLLLGVPFFITAFAREEELPTEERLLLCSSPRLYSGPLVDVK